MYVRTERLRCVDADFAERMIQFSGARKECFDAASYTGPLAHQPNAVNAKDHAGAQLACTVVGSARWKRARPIAKMTLAHTVAPMLTAVRAAPYIAPARASSFRMPPRLSRYRSRKRAKRCSVSTWALLRFSLPIMAS